MDDQKDRDNLNFINQGIPLNRDDNYSHYFSVIKPLLGGTIPEGLVAGLLFSLVALGLWCPTGFHIILLNIVNLSSEITWGCIY